MASRDLFDTVSQREISRNAPSPLEGVSIYIPEIMDATPQGYGRFGVGDSKYDWGIKPDDINTLADRRAARQSSGEQFLAFANQATVGQIVGSGIEGIGYLGDLKSYADLINGTEKEFGNWFSDIGKKLQTWTEEATPIYVDPDQKAFAPNHWSWWMQNGKSVTSTLALMIPAAGVWKGISAIGKGIKFWEKMVPLVEALKPAGTTLETAIGTAKWAATGLGEAAISRHMESMQNAAGVYKEAYTAGLGKGMSDVDAKDYAARAAAKDYGLEWAMYLQDVPQYLLLNRAFGKGKIGKLADKSLDAEKALGHSLLPIIGAKSAAIGWDMLGEGFEEGYQYIIQEESKYLEDKLRDPKTDSSFGTRINKYLNDGNFWTNAAMGALGAGVMQTAGKKINDLIQGGDPQTRYVKDFGAKISQAAQAVHFADIMGSESGKQSAVTNLEKVLFTHAKTLDMMDDAKELLKRTANLTPEDAARFGIKPEDLETLQLNHEEILKHADTYEKLWDDNSKKFAMDTEKISKVTNAEFTIDTFNGYKNDYTARLSELKDKITNFRSLSFEAQDMLGISSEILSKQKTIDFQNKRLADTANKLNPQQIKQVKSSIKGTEEDINRIKGNLNKLDESRDEETKNADDAIDIGGPYNLLTAKDDKEITGHSILEYKKLDEALAFAESTLKSAQENLKEALSNKKEPKPEPVDKDLLDRIPEQNDYVQYTADGKTNTGIVDYLDEAGDYVIIPTTKWSEDSKYATKPLETSVTVSADKVVLDKKQYSEEDIQDESVGSDDVNSEVTTDEDIFSSYKYLDVSYMHDEGGNIPVVDNEDLNRYLSNPANNLEGVNAEMAVDTTSEYAIKYFKDKGFTDIEIRKITNGKLTDNDINELKARLGGFDTIPISVVLVKDGKVLFKGGMFYHNTDFTGRGAPSYITSQGEEVTRRYLADQKQRLRRSRFRIVPELLKGNEVYSDTLVKGAGFYDNTKDRGNVLERHSIAINDARMAVSRKNGRAYKSANDTIPGVTVNTAGTILVPTKNTIDGKDKWVKVNPTKLTKEHAEILWDAIITRYTKGKGRMAAFPDARVESLSVGEVITMLTLFGDLKTNPKHENNKDMAAHLANKAFFVHSGRDLTFGSTTINIHEDNMNIEETNKKAFIEWATKNKNYSIPLGIKPMGIELNSPLRRTFKIGSWENKADKDGNFLTMAQFLMSSPVDGKNQFAVVSDFKGFTRPALMLGDNESDIKIRIPVSRKPKVPKQTSKSKARTKTINKVKTTPTVDSPIDIVNLPVGAKLYFKSSSIIEDKEVPFDMFFATVIFDNKLGNVLDLSGFQSPYVHETWGDWIELEQEDSFKKADAFVTYLKNRPHIAKVLVDLSNIVEETPVKPIVEQAQIKDQLSQEELNQIENEIKEQDYNKLSQDSNQETKDTATNVTDLTMPKSDETVDDLENLLGIPGVPMLEFSEPVKSIIDLPKELKWFHEKFGNQNVQQSDKLLTLAASGRKAFSIFTADCTYVFTGAPQGALYHEAFHRVFLGYLSKEDRDKIYESYRKKFNYDMDDNMVSERLAEEFRQHRLAGTKPKSRTVLQFFKDLGNFIYTFFTGNTRLSTFEIDKLYDSINRGQFKYSKISDANRKALEGVETPMAVEIRKHEITLINNYHDLDKVVKFLTGILIQTNEIDNLNDIKNIKMSKMKDEVDAIIVRLNNMIVNTQKQLDDNLIPKDQIEDKQSRMAVSTNLLNILQLVISKEFSQLFVDKIGDQLVKLNVRRIQDEDNELEDKINNDYKAKYDQASYEINSKDNILASVKFLIATLKKDNKLDPNIGIAEFVDFNEMWNSLMYNLYDINDVDEMMDRLNGLTDKFAYQDLVNKLNKDITGDKKRQLRAAVQKHRHDFINFLFTVSKEGVPTFEIRSADVSNASKREIGSWNLFFYGSKAIDVKAEGIVVDDKILSDIFAEYTKLSKRVETEYTKNNNSFINKESIIADLATLFKRIGVDIDSLSIDALIKERRAENIDDALFQTVVSDFSFIFNKINNAKLYDVRQIFNDEKYIKALADAYVKSHPEKISDMVLGPSNNQYFVYAQNSYVTDTVRKIRTDKTYLEEHLNKIYNDNSYYGQQLLANDEVRQGLEIMTFAMFGKKGSSGDDYLGINPIEDYVFKLTAMANGLIPFPTMADRKTFYMLKGVTPLDFHYTVDNEGKSHMPEEAITILLGYAKSEKNRIETARLAIKARQDAKEAGNTELVNQLDKELVENYHYKIKGKEKFFGGENSSALLYHNFPSFNRKDFDFDRDARNEVRQSITDNVREELEYAESLGIIGSTIDLKTNKKRYYNRLLDAALVKKESENYGSIDMAVKNIIASFFINTIIANNEVEKLFSGDPAFFKTDKDTHRVIEDRVKRLSVLTSTGDNFDNSVKEKDLNDSTFNIVTVATQKLRSVYYNDLERWHTELQTRRISKENPELTKEQVASEVTAIVSDVLKAYREFDPTDGQAWISPEMYRSLSNRLGEWSTEKETAFNLLQLDRELTPEEEKQTLNVTFQPLKLVYFSLLHDGNLAIPTYHKASFATIFRTMTKGTYGDRQIKDMLDRMELKGKYSNSKEKVDMFMMDSATKVGNRSKTYLLDESLENMNDLSNLTVYQQPFSGLRRQLITDSHDVDRTKTGTQFLKMVLGNLVLEEEVYTIDGKQVTGKYIRDVVFSALNSLSNSGRKSLEDKLGFKDGKINKKKLVELLTDDAKSSNASDDLIDSISMIGSDELYLELDALTDHKWIQSRIISLISKFTVDVKLPGNQLIQFANFGIRSVNEKYTFEEELKEKDKHVSWIKNGTDDLKWITLEDGKVVPMGCIVSINLFKHIIPNYNEISYKEKVAYLANNPDILGYRIPTQGQNSTFMFTVTGVYPETIGDTITLPAEFTALTGSDFDIDKVFVVRHNYHVNNETKEISKIKFLEGDTNDPKFLEKVYKERYGSILRKREFVKKQRLEDAVTFTEVQKEVLEQMKESSDDEVVTSYIDKLLTYNRYVPEWWNGINDQLKHYNLEEYIKENKGKSVYDINSKKAVENRLIDAFFSVMRSEAHFTSTSAPLGPLTDRLKKKAQKIRASLDTERVNMYYQSPRFNEGVKHTYNGGKSGIGPFALNNVHHVLAQLAGLEMKGSFGDVMYTANDGKNIDLSKSRGKDKLLILDWFSALIDAHVDVAKDPYIMDLNVNSFTYNVLSLLLRGGAGEVSFDFLAQPILRELANETLLSNEDSDLHKLLRVEDGLDDENEPKYKYVKADEYISRKWGSKLTAEEKKAIDEMSLPEAFSTFLSDDVFNADSTDKAFIKRQMLVFKAFKELQSKGNDLNTLVQASQIDTKKFGSNITELRVFINRIRKAYDIKKFVNIEKILPYNPETGEVLNGPDANFLGTYATNAIKFSLDVMSDISIYATPVFDEIFNKIINVTGNEFITDPKFINLISDEIFTSMVSKFFTSEEYAGYTSDKLNRLLEAASQKLAKIKFNEHGEFDDLKDNIFINYLTLIPTNDDIIKKIIPMFISVPMKSTKDKADKDNMINSFKELLKHNKEEVRDTARYLFYYAYFTSGYRSRIYSFFNVLPNNMYRDLLAKDPNNTNEYIHISYNKFIKKIFTETKNFMNITSYTDLVDEVLINNHENDNLIKLIKENTNSVYSTVFEYKGKTYPRQIAVVLTEKLGAKLMLGSNDSMQPVLRPLIKMFDPTTGHIVLKYIGTIENKPVYATQNMRSYTARGVVIKEYGLDKSIIPAYNDMMVITPAMEEEFIKYLANGKTYQYVPKAQQLAVVEKEQVDENKEETTQEGQQGMLTGFQGYKGGYEDIGKGTKEGDGKDKAMRKDASGFIGEFVRKNSSTYESARIIQLRETGDSTPLILGETILSETTGAKIVMLARNSEFKGKPLAELTKKEVLASHNEESTFIVGDMPGVDSGFIDYLQEIGATFKIYYSGNSSRINLEVNPPTQLDLFSQVDSVKDIYSKLGNKTVSENVKIVDKPYIYSDEQKKGNAIVAYKSTKMPESFENPFHTRTDKTTKENVIDFINFVLNSNEPQAIWIREKAKSGEFKGKPIYYGNTKANKENEPSHATALDYLINKYDWSSEVNEYPFLSDAEQTDVQFSTEKQGVSDLVNELGIIDWTKVTESEWAKLRDKYLKCKV